MNKIISRNLIVSFLLLMLMVASIAGATYAWFTSSSAVVKNVFTAGTVELSDPNPTDITSSTNIDPDSICETIEWQFSSTGKKNTHIRVRPEAEAIGEKTEIEDETAWVGVDGGNENFKPINSGQDWNQYYEYDLNEFGDGEELELDILASSEFKYVGDAATKVYADTLYIDLETRNNWKMEEVHIYANTEPPSTHSPGQLGWGFENLTGSLRTQFPFDTDILNNDPDKLISDLDGNEKIYIVVHLKVFKEASTTNGDTIELNVEIALCAGQENDWHESGGWWYYGDEDEPYVVNINLPVVTVCFKYCVTASDGYEIKSMEAYLEAEAVQASNYAIDYIWDDPEHYWYPLKPKE